jgi:hypothetical protein
MKIVVVDVDQDGRSYARVVTELAEPDPSVTLWVEPDLGAVRTVIAGINGDSAMTSAEPPVGGFNWVYRTFRAQSDPAVPEFGMHVTRTIDFDFCLFGHMRCILDIGAVDLYPGDAIVIKGANHSWQNPGTVDAGMVFLLHHPEP